MFRSPPALAVVCGESSLGYTFQVCVIVNRKLWFAGNRRSDTLPTAVPTVRAPLWFAGNRRSDTLIIRVLVLIGKLWFAGNRRSDTLANGK